MRNVLNSLVLMSTVLLSSLSFAAPQVFIPVIGSHILPGDYMVVNVKPFLFTDVAYKLICHIKIDMVTDNSYIKVTPVLGTSKLTVDGKTSSLNQFKLTLNSVIEDEGFEIPKNSKDKYEIRVQNLNPDSAIIMEDCNAFPLTN